MTHRAAAAELEDRDIIARVVAGDHAAFEVLVRRYNQRLYRAARAITRSDADAEDVLQQAWLGVFRNLSQFRGDAAFATWATPRAMSRPTPTWRAPGSARCSRPAWRTSRRATAR